MNYKNLNYEIETLFLGTLPSRGPADAMNYKNLNYEIETDKTVSGGWNSISDYEL